MADNPQGQTQGGSAKPSLNWQAPQAPKPAAPTPPTTQPPPANKTSEGPSSPTSTYVMIFIVGLIIGILLGWAIAGSRNGRTSDTASSTTTSIDTSNMGAASAPTSPDITVNSPQPAGNNVLVAKASVSQPTWVLVYDNING